FAFTPFVFSHAPSTSFYLLSLHDALPISEREQQQLHAIGANQSRLLVHDAHQAFIVHHHLFRSSGECPPPAGFMTGVTAWIMSFATSASGTCTVVPSLAIISSVFLFNTTMLMRRLISS